MKKELNKILWNNVDIKGDRPMKKELQVDLETFINQKLQQAEQRKIEEIIEELFKIEKEKWNDAEHCSCLGYALIKISGGEDSQAGKEMEKRLQSLKTLTTNK